MNKELGQLKILVVEDNEMNRELLIKQFSNLDYQVDIAEDGHSAFECFKLCNHDIIFMDLQMPTMDGLEATRNIRNHCNNPHVPVIIALTGSASEDKWEECFSAGMNDYLAKPTSMNDIDLMIKKWAPNLVQED